MIGHIRAFARENLPGDLQSFYLRDSLVGWVTPYFAAQLAARGCSLTADGVGLPDPALLTALIDDLAASGCLRLRGEAFDVRAVPGGPVLACIDRGALPCFGIVAEGVHVNGLVHRPGGIFLWVGRRAADKALDAGKLDHLVAGGISAGMDAAETLVKEAGEEAGIPPALARQARPVGTIAYAIARAEGLRRDRLHCYDLAVPDDFRPVPRDGEVAGFELWPIERVAETVRAGDGFKFNVNLVLIDLFLRLGVIAADGAEGRTLRAGLSALAVD